MRNTACHQAFAGVIRGVAGAFAGTVLIAAVAGPAAAHTALEGSSPDDGARVAVAPDHVELDFTEPLRGRLTRVTVRGPGDARFEQGAPEVASNKVVQPLRLLGPPGLYQIDFRVVADDGHPLAGSVRFTLTRPGPGAAPSSPGTGSATVPGATPTARAAAKRPGGVPPWTLATGAVAAIVIVSGVAWFGRRMTRDLD